MEEFFSWKTFAKVFQATCFDFCRFLFYWTAVTQSTKLSASKLASKPGFKVHLSKNRMHANAIWWMSDPSWVKCPPSSHSNDISGDTKAGKPSPPRRIEIVMLCLLIILWDESQTVSNRPLHNSSTTLNPTNSQQTITQRCKKHEKLLKISTFV